jgi:hypothetical protein
LLSDAGVRKRTSVPQQPGVSDARHASVLQQQAEIKRKDELLEDCWHLLAAGQYNYEQLLRHPLIAQLTDQERSDLFWEFQQQMQHSSCQQAPPVAPRKRAHGKMSSRCVVM